MASLLPHGRSIAFHVFVAIAVGGILLPWATVAGRTRSGPGTANVLLSLADAGAPDGLGLLGAIWYLGAAFIVVGWAAHTVTVKAVWRRGGFAVLIAAAMSWTVYLAWAWSSDQLSLEPSGPILASAGLTGALLSWTSEGNGWGSMPGEPVSTLKK